MHIGSLSFAKSGMQIVNKLAPKMQVAHLEVVNIETEFKDLCDRYRITVDAATVMMEEMLNRRPKAYMAGASLEAPFTGSVADSGGSSVVNRALRERDRDDLFEVYQRLYQARAEYESLRSIVENIDPQETFRLNQSEILTIGF